MIYKGGVYTMKNEWKQGFKYGVCYNRNRFDFKLSKNMRDYLRKKKIDPDIKGSKPTITALIKRDLCFGDGGLTETGNTVAISLLPLSKQCYFLNVPLEDLVLEYCGYPEEAVINHLTSRSKIAYFTENAFGVHIAQFFMFKYQYDIAIKHNMNLYSIAFTADDYSRKFIYDEILYNLNEMTEDISVDTIEENHQLIQKLNSQYNSTLDFSITIDINDKVNVSSSEPRDQNGQLMMTFFYQDIWGIEFYKSLYSFLGVEFIRKLIKFIIHNPFYYSTGWPDIVVLEKKPYFIEVKTTDKFHMSQIITMRDVMQKADIPIKCVRVKKVKKA